ncbi:MAG TPA: RidA family protein [candidate division Zixibacteria bacterium]|nr:RidA family protein [candidate division Zixibacteria bacterium]MDD4918249.1 RidA family protein [candidate division Zixibacteria bacterium]MDM7973990.1 RidA family protein [candidate division Zixibacteria bacterium]HOD66519.1 RidA family protein [candidate division Zixibacteria bacterium]HOZ06654.1 RidA family protein [candidate division Zixibacteria bacterium]
MTPRSDNPARRRVSSGSPYEEPFGFCRAIRVGNAIHVAGTGPIAADGSTGAPGDPYGQTMRCLEIIRTAIEQLGGRAADVVRTRIYVTDLTRQDEIGRAHGEFFREINPAATMIGVAGLVRADWYVEIEAEAIVDE